MISRVSGTEKTFRKYLPICSLIFILSFLLLTLGFACSSFSHSFKFCEHTLHWSKPYPIPTCMTGLPASPSTHPHSLSSQHSGPWCSCFHSASEPKSPLSPKALPVLPSPSEGNTHIPLWGCRGQGWQGARTWVSVSREMVGFPTPIR